MTTKKYAGVLPTDAGSILLSAENLPRPIVRISKNKNPTVEEALVVIEYCDDKIKEAYHKHNYEGVDTSKELRNMSFRRIFGFSITSVVACFTSAVSFAMGGNDPLHFAISKGSLLAMIPLAVGPLAFTISTSNKDDSTLYTLIAPRKSKKIRGKAKIEDALKAIKQEEFKQIETAMLTLVAPSLKVINETLAPQNRELVYASSYANEGFVMCEKQEVKDLDKWRKIGRMALPEPVASHQSPAKKTKKLKAIED